MAVKITVDYSVFEKKAKSLIKNAPQVYLERVKKATQDRTPVQTGALKANWDIKGLSLENDKDYAHIIEYGSAGRAGAFMLTTSVLESQRDWDIAAKRTFK